MQRGKRPVGTIGNDLLGMQLLYVALQESTRKFEKAMSHSEAILNSTIDGIITVDSEGTIQTFNIAAECLFEYTHDEIIGQNIKILVPEPHRSNHDKYVKKHVDGIMQGTVSGTVVCMEVVGVRKDGNEIPLELSLSPNISDEGISFTAVVRNITERLAFERELLEAKEEAESASEAKSAFLANMSHEIRTPMNGVIGMSDLLLDTNLDEQQLEFVKTVQKSATSLLNIINDILDFTKIESGELLLEPIPFNLCSTLEDIADSFISTVAEKGIDIILRYEMGIPEIVVSDPGRIRQIMTNLISNAIKFTSKGHVFIEIESIGITEGKMNLKISVHDTGIGIPIEKQAQVFERFSQADVSTTRKFGGTGLGLAITQQLIGLMDGEINLSSEVNVGTTVEVLLTMPLGSPMEAQDKFAHSLDKIKVLIVDTNTSRIEIMQEQMDYMGATCEIASSGASALGLLDIADNSNKQFDIALIDQSIAGDISAKELGEKISTDNRYKNIKLVICTSIGVRGEPSSFYKSGFSGYMTKPYKPHTVQGIVKEVLKMDGEENSAIITRHSVRENQRKDKKDIHKKINTHRALIVEDDLINQRVLTMILQSMGYDSVIANNGIEALGALQSGVNYDIVFMDMQMPQMDGVTATKKIREYEKHKGLLPVKIIALTANHSPEDKSKCFNAGMNDYVTKPVTKDKLAKAILAL